MLEYVHVKNIALIREAELTLSDHLNILSGETGAGKSILLGALQLALGERGSTDLVRTGESEGFVELVFSVTDPQTSEKLAELSVEPEDGKLILSRRISEKRSVLRLNSEVVPAAFVRKVSALLLDIYGQYEHQSLLSEENHLRYLDTYAGAEISDAFQQYQECYRAYRKLREEIRSLGGEDDDERRKRLDFLGFQLTEIENANIRIGEDEALTKELRKLSSARAIENALNLTHSALSGDLPDALSESIREISGLVSTDPGLSALLSELRDIESLMQDAASDAEERLQSLDTDGERMNLVEERLQFLSQIKRKYGATEEEILKSFDRLQREYDSLKDFDENRERMLSELAVLRKSLVQAAKVLHDQRRACADELQQEMTEALLDLNFLQVRFECEVQETNRFSPNGADEVRFLISTNPGEPVKPLARVASGGELSRIMLALRTVSADTDGIHTLVFDEIDAGISGKTAAAVARRMHKIAADHQVICISHLPQIVAAADHHFLIEKTASEGSALTEVQELSEDESIRELARLLGAEETTEAGILNAREMKALMKG
ncbi:MAG: DNA repair protein RecN [Lachnospiraceae bacterium]|nr:DNA repair protein RecN [Lachnospiraceae bacterium]